MLGMVLPFAREANEYAEILWIITGLSASFAHIAEAPSYGVMLPARISSGGAGRMLTSNSLWAPASARAAAPDAATITAMRAVCLVTGQAVHGAASPLDLRRFCGSERVCHFLCISHAEGCTRAECIERKAMLYPKNAVRNIAIRY